MSSSVLGLEISQPSWNWQPTNLATSTKSLHWHPDWFMNGLWNNPGVRILSHHQVFQGGFPMLLFDNLRSFPSPYRKQITQGFVPTAQASYLQVGYHSLPILVADCLGELFFKFSHFGPWNNWLVEPPPTKVTHLLGLLNVGKMIIWSAHEHSLRYAKRAKKSLNFTFVFENYLGMFQEVTMLSKWVPTPRNTRFTIGRGTHNSSRPSIPSRSVPAMQHWNSALQGVVVDPERSTA